MFFNFKFSKAVNLIDFKNGNREGYEALINTIYEHLMGSQYKIEAILATEFARIRAINNDRSHACTHLSERFEKA